MENGSSMGCVYVKGLQHALAQTYDCTVVSIYRETEKTRGEAGAGLGAGGGPAATAGTAAKTVVHGRAPDGHPRLIPS